MNILYIGNPASIHDIKWAGYIAEKPGTNVFFLYEKQHNHLITSSVLSRLKKHGIHLNSPIADFSVKRPFATFFSVKALRRIITEYEIDFVHALFATPHALWLNFINVPFGITTRGSDVNNVLPELLSGTGLKGIYKKILFRLFKRAFKKSAFIASTSQLQVDKMHELFGKLNHVNVIRTGIDFDRITALTNTVNPLASEYVFFPRYILPIYNTLLQVDAIALLPLEIKKRFVFVFIKGTVADENYAIKVEKMLEKIKGINYVFIEQLSQEDLWIYFKHASLTVMTPLSDGTPNTALEAMAARCPLIIGNKGYDVELFQNTCLKLENYNPEDLADLIKFAINNYPSNLLTNAYEVVAFLGNRNIEMEKLYLLYMKTVSATQFLNK